MSNECATAEQRISGIIWVTLLLYLGWFRVGIGGVEFDIMNRVVKDIAVNII